MEILNWLRSVIHTVKFLQISHSRHHHQNRLLGAAILTTLKTYKCYSILCSSWNRAVVVLVILPFLCYWLTTSAGHSCISFFRFDLDSSTLGTMFSVLLTSSSSFSALGVVPCCNVDDDADGKTFSSPDIFLNHHLLYASSVSIVQSQRINLR